MAKAKILLVDDEVKFCEMVKKNLESLGTYEVRTVSQAAQAVNTTREFMPDLILMDVIMPNRRGSDVAFEIKADPSLTHIPILFLTALAADDQEELFLGMVDGKPFYARPVLAKPVTPPELDKCIRANLPAERFDG